MRVKIDGLATGIARIKTVAILLEVYSAVLGVLALTPRNRNRRHSDDRRRRGRTSRYREKAASNGGPMFNLPTVASTEVRRILG